MKHLCRPCAPVDKVKVFFAIVMAVVITYDSIRTTYQDAEKAHWSHHSDVHEKSKVLADLLLSAESTYHKPRHSLRSSRCLDQVSAGKAPSRIKKRTTIKLKQIKTRVRANYSTGKDKQVCPYKSICIW